MFWVKRRSAGGYSTWDGYTQGIGHLPHNPQPVVYTTWNDEARVLLPAENRSELDTPFCLLASVWTLDWGEMEYIGWGFAYRPSMGGNGIHIPEDGERGWAWEGEGASCIF